MTWRTVGFGPVGLAGGLVALVAILGLAALFGYLFSVLLVHAFFGLLHDVGRSIGCEIGKAVHSASYRCGKN